MDRITYLSDLYRQSIEILTKDKKEWMGLLAGMAHFYQMSFDKNVLVHVQRPANSGLIATMKGWREETGRSIKRGAKSIAVLNLNQPRASLSYYFDITDTYGDYESLRKAMSLVWEVEAQYRPELLARFQAKNHDQSETMEECLLKLVEKQIAQLLPDQMKQFKVNDPASMLYSMPEDAVKQEFIQLVRDSTGYVVLKKCGLSTDLLEQNGFSNISHYNSLQLFMALGSCTLFHARPILKEVKEQIEAIKQERSKQYEQKLNENRAVNPVDVQNGSRRDAISQHSDIRQRTNQRSEELREDVERVHDPGSPTPPVRADRRGQDQSDDPTRGRGSGNGEGADNKRTAESPAHARDRGYTGESGPHEHDNKYSGGDHHQRSGTESQVEQKDDPKEHMEETRPSVNGERPFTGGFSVPPRSRSKPEESEEGEEGSKVKEEQERTAEMPEESLSEKVVDSFLCSKEMITDPRTSLSDIYTCFTSGRKQEQKELMIKYTYEELDMDYWMDSENHLLVRGIEDGITFTGEVYSFYISYHELTDRIDYLIWKGSYPNSNEELALDEYAIPDETAEMRLEKNHEVSDEQPPELILEPISQSVSEPVSESVLEPVTAEYQQYSFGGEPFNNQDIYPPKEENTSNIVSIPKENYRFSLEHHLYEGGAKTKCRNNIAAIALLKKLQEENRMADSEEQIILAKYVGWGGLANALTPNKSGWEEEYSQIKALLSEEEFQSAQESTTTAYYTEQEVIQCMYQALERFGFREGNILDPAMGNGNFFSVLPESMSRSKLYGVEIDTITGRIARQLYPDANIEIRGYEDTQYPDQFFDVAVGNIPFNSLTINDSRYNKYHFKIHDYFIAKTLDKVRAGGIIAFITTKGTMDKRNSAVRKYIAGKAELIGAIRLPNTAFQAVAGTKATADILFLKKREREISPTEENSPWISVMENEDGIPINGYFLEHPEMVLGKMVYDESMYANGNTTACIPIEGEDFLERLKTMIYYLDSAYEEPASEFEEEMENRIESIVADPAVKNFSYTLVDEKIYYREHSRMYHQDITGKKAERIKGMIGIHQAIRAIIDFQTNAHNREYLEPVIYEQQLQALIQKLNQVYDQFVSKYGYLNSYANVIAFSKDGAAPLVRSVEEEVKDQKGEYKKTAIFYKPTIHQYSMPKKAENAEEALKISLNTKGRVDLAYMTQIYEKADQTNATAEEIIQELGERIYQDPAQYFGEPYAGWVVAEEYLSGYVKDKLAEAILKAEQEPERFHPNVEALRLVQPEPLAANEISFTLGSTWIPVEIYQQFMHDTFKTQVHHKYGSGAIMLEFSRYSGAYFISNKSAENDHITITKTYGTERINAYEILENSLNLKTVEVRDRVDYVDENGEDKVKYVLNRAETILAREKQAELKLAFENWLFAEPERSANLIARYNDLFNNVRPRVYNGDDLVLPDISQEIKLRKHQKDAIAHAIYGQGNLGIFHEVGAGKTMSGIAAAYELKRLNIVNKPLFAVPNHLVGQWAREYLRLYPNANILVAEKKDFEKKNRRRFVSRIASGDYHAIIMAQSSFELIGLSREKQISALKEEINAITEAIEEEKKRTDKSWSLKQMMIFRSNLQNRYDLLFKAEKKDDVITFEELGVDALIADEAHAYKNNFSYTKMRGVAGVGSSSSQRAMDMHMKCQYINEINQGRGGVIYLTGTPIANSMSELFVLQKTLQPKDLQERGLLMFDSWASTFGKVEASLEIKPEGNGYQMKSRFARFHNLPELLSMFSMIADIKTADMLDLPVPKMKTGGAQVIKTRITSEQKAMIVKQGERAEKIRAGVVDSSEDNFLKLTMEARLLAVDPRILDPTIPDDPDTKLNVCGRKVAEVYHETAEQKSAQIVFCDQGTPKADGGFNFYDVLKENLIDQGVKTEEIAFIHEAKTDVQKEQLYEKVRNGEVRVLIGSTVRMGTGMNCQNKLIALHHLDIPWRPADLIQRNGRILRQGNENEEISIFNYITEETFDSYLWQILEQKQRYISQIMTGRSSLRSCEDVDDTVLQYAEFKALAISDERIKEKMEVDNEIQRLQILKSSWKNGQSNLQSKIAHEYPVEIKRTEKIVADLMADVEQYQQNKPAEFQMKLGDIVHTERSKAAEHFKVLSRKLGQETGSTLSIGSYGGFTINLKRPMAHEMRLCLKGEGVYYTDIGDSELGAIMRMEHLAERIPQMLLEGEQKLESLKEQLEEAKQEITRPFASEERLSHLLKKKVELDLALEFKEDARDKEGDTELVSKSEGHMKKKEVEMIKAEQSLFQLIYPLAQPIFEGQAYYMKYQAEGFNDLVLEAIGDDEYSIAHYYEQNGDAMRDPEITFTLNMEDESLHPTSYLQDNMGIFYETSEVSWEAVQDLEDFMHTWFVNIKEQGFELHKTEYYESSLLIAEEECVR